MTMPRTPNDARQETFSLPFDHAQVTVDATLRLLKVPAGKRARIDQVQYINPTGLAAHAANFANLKILKNAAIAANWSTETGQQGGLTADTWVDFVKSATDGNLVLEGGDQMSLFLDLSGTTTLPAGRVVVHYRYV